MCYSSLFVYSLYRSLLIVLIDPSIFSILFLRFSTSLQSFHFFFFSGGLPVSSSFLWSCKFSFYLVPSFAVYFLSSFFPPKLFHLRPLFPDFRVLSSSFLFLSSVGKVGAVVCAGFMLGVNCDCILVWGGNFRFFFLMGKTMCCCCCSVTQSCPTLCDPMHCSTLGFPVLHHLAEFAQTHIHWIRDAIQQSHPLLSPYFPVFNLSQH